MEHDPSRYESRRNAPQPQGELGDPPNYFDDVHRDMWREIAAMPPPGVLTSADRILVEITARLLRRFRTPFKQQNAETPPLTAVEIGHLRACLGSMGLTPADRGRVTGSDAPQKPQDPLDELARARASRKVN